MGKLRVALFLLNEQGEYQRLLRHDAETASKRHGFDLHGPFFCNNNQEVQSGQLSTCIFGDKPDVIVASGAGTGAHLVSFMRAAATRGIGLISLNTTVPNIEMIRTEYDKADKDAPMKRIPWAVVTADQREAGRIQGRQVAAAFPNGGFALYVTGPSQASAAREREEGTRQVFSSLSAPMTLSVALEGNWTREGAKEPVRKWLRTITNKGTVGQAHLDAIICQSDPTALGAYDAVQELIGEFQAQLSSATPKIIEMLRHITFFGIDGAEGRQAVNEGKLTATVVMPSCSGSAFDLIAAAANGGEVKDILLRPEPYALNLSSGPLRQAV